LKLIILVSNGDLVAACGISCEFYLLLASPSNKTIDDFSKLSSLHMVETFQAIKLCSKVRKNKELMKELFARYIFGKLSSDQ
jgi:hypothetical protein